MNKSLAGLTQPAFTQHPITQAEFKYQRHVIDSSRAGRFWILLAFLLMIPSLLISLALTAAFFIGLPIPSVIFALPDSVPPPFSTLGIGLLVVMNIALYVVVTMVTYGLALNSISREKQGKTWDTLLLTEVSARHLVLGKWWATLRALWGDHTMVVLLRLGFTVWLITELVRLAMVSSTPILWVDTVIGTPVYVLALLFLVVVYTVVDMGFTVALGVLSAVVDLPSVVVTTGAIAARLIVTAGSIIVPLALTGNLRLYTELASAIGGLLVVGLLVMLTWMTLWLARVFALRQYAL